MIAVGKKGFGSIRIVSVPVVEVVFIAIVVIKRMPIGRLMKPGRRSDCKRDGRFGEHTGRRGAVLKVESRKVIGIGAAVGVGEGVL